MTSLYMTFSTLSLSQETLDSLSDLYVSLSEEDLWAGLWMERCRFLETAVAVAYETQGLFELAQESYEKVWPLNITCNSLTAVELLHGVKYHSSKCTQIQCT